MKINELFVPKNAKSRNLESYADGNIPFVSNSVLNNGIVEYVDSDSPKELITEVPCIAVNGFGFATVQTNPFIGAGNGGVHVISLIPIKKMSIIELAFYASQINHASWRFSYGRRAILRRLLQVNLTMFNLSKSDIESFETAFLKKTESSIKEVLG